MIEGHNYVMDGIAWWDHWHKILFQFQRVFRRYIIHVECVCSLELSPSLARADFVGLFYFPVPIVRS